MSGIQVSARLEAASDLALIEEFIAQAEVGETTRKKYRSQLGEFRAWLVHPRNERGGAASLLNAGRADVVRFAAYLAEGDRFASTGHRKVKLGAVSPSTRKSYFASLRNFYRYLMTIDLVAWDPTEGVKRPTVKVQPGLRLTAEELRQLLAVPGKPRERIQAFLLAYTAARVNELRGLRWKDVNFQEGTLMLHGKGDKYRVISIHPRLMPELRRWYLGQEVDAMKYPKMLAARSDEQTNYVLMTRNGGPVAINAIAQQLKIRAERAGLYVLNPSNPRNGRSRVSPHALRRTFATLLLNDGHHLDAVADVLGHVNLDTTRKHYAFTSSERMRATVEGFTF
ncbi:MAG: xerD [Thermoleophilia bacterium]|nr:xerD [Thermoleophilia bacterium]